MGHSFNRARSTIFICPVLFFASSFIALPMRNVFAHASFGRSGSHAGNNIVRTGVVGTMLYPQIYLFLSLRMADYIYAYHCSPTLWVTFFSYTFILILWEQELYHLSSGILQKSGSCRFDRWLHAFIAILCNWLCIPCTIHMAL
ncbi:hypothetical protein V8D89_014283 [Ganoderma adspersum]